MTNFNSFYEKVYESLPSSPRHRYRRLDSMGSSGRRLGRLPVILAAVTLSSLFFILLLHSHNHPTFPSEPNQVHLLIPANNPDPNLCKAVLSASILGYPAAKVLNWGRIFNNEHLVSGGSHIAKISGVKAYLDSLERHKDDDLVLMVDGYDVWFQLRPQTLIDRYMDINRRANERIREEIGAGTARRHNIKQDIIFSVQKRCWPWDTEDSPCYAVPQSSLPPDVYGDQTDTDIGDKANPYIKFRPRYLNSGVAIGTASAMRALFAEALVRAERDPNFGSDQRIFSAILGEQEVWREVLRRRDMGWFKRLTWVLNGPDSRADIFLPSDVERSAWHNKPLEFGLGLDYEGSLGLATVFAEEDTEWITFSNKTELAAVNSARNITPAKSRLRIHDDISSTLAPFHDAPNLPQKSWSEIPLLTDVYTGFTPAIIHHNAHRNGLKSLRETWWEKIWYQRDARILMDAAVNAPEDPIAYSGGRVWRSDDGERGGVRDDVANWLGYEEVCRGTHDEVFRDGGGGWFAPLRPGRGGG